jgi:hypothetical protein
MFGRIGWGLSYDYSKEDFDDGSSFESQVIEALGRWETTDRSSVFAVVGYEDNEFELDPSLASPDGFLWRVGATYQPATRGRSLRGFSVNATLAAPTVWKCATRCAQASYSPTTGKS